MSGLADKLKAREASTTVPTVAEVAPVAEKVEESKSDFAQSAEQLEKLRDGRNESDIPLQDAYWLQRNVHSLAHGAHPLRVDELETIKGKPVEK